MLFPAAKRTTSRYHHFFSFIHKFYAHLPTTLAFLCAMRSLCATTRRRFPTISINPNESGTRIHVLVFYHKLFNVYQLLIKSTSTPNCVCVYVGLITNRAPYSISIRKAGGNQTKKQVPLEIQKWSRCQKLWIIVGQWICHKTGSDWLISFKFLIGFENSINKKQLNHLILTTNQQIAIPFSSSVSNSFLSLSRRLPLLKTRAQFEFPLRCHIQWSELQIGLDYSPICDKMFENKLLIDRFNRLWVIAAV